MNGDHVAEVVGGLEDMARAELATLGASDLVRSEGEVRFSHGRPAAVLAGSHLVSAVYLSVEFAVPRPKALMGDAAFRRLTAAMKEVAARGGMSTFRLAAAGLGTPVFRRLASELAGATGLAEDVADGGLLTRVRRSRQAGWEVLLRLSPRPLSTRTWRVCNLPGGANATVAAAMVRLGGDGSFLNLMCGSGTLLVERAQLAPGTAVVGVDVSEEAIECARANLAAAGITDHRLHVGDVTDAGFEVPSPASAGAAATFDVVAADAPWGDAVGRHEANEALYRALLGAARRYTVPGGRFVLLTHEVRLTERLVAEAAGWRVSGARRVEHGGHNPLLLVLESVG